MCATSETRTALQRVNDEFYRAFEALDVSHMGSVWGDSDHVTCVHPGWEILRGRALVLRSFELIFQSTSSIRFNLSDVHIRITGDFALVHCVEDILLDCGSGLTMSRAVATNGFERRDGAWRMVLHHASAFEPRMTDRPPSSN